MEKIQKTDAVKVDYSDMVKKLLACHNAADAMAILQGKKVPEIKVIMEMVKAEKDRIGEEKKQAEMVKEEVESLLHATYGKPAVLPKAEVITNKTRLAVWIFGQNAGLTKPEFVAEFVRIRDELKLKFTD